MPRFFFIQHECDGTITGDSAGVVAPDLEGARSEAIRRARAVMSQEIAEGRLCLSCWIVITDDNGFYLETLHFGEAIQMRGQHCSASARGEHAPDAAA